MLELLGRHDFNAEEHTREHRNSPTPSSGPFTREQASGIAAQYDNITIEDDQWNAFSSGYTLRG
jgi:hypothetical protein